MSGDYQGNKGLEYYRAYPRDFFEGVVGMDGPLRGFYRMVLDMIYMHDGLLLNDWHHISGLTGYGPTQCKRMMQKLIDAEKIGIWAENPEYFINNRAVSELKTSRKFQENQTKKAAIRWNNNGLAGSSAYPEAVPDTIPPQDHKTTIQSASHSYAHEKKNTVPVPLFAGQEKKGTAPKPKVDPARAVLIEVASSDAVDEYLKFRKGTRAKGTTLRAAQMISKQLKDIVDRGGSADEALDMAAVQGWQGMQADWYFNKKGQGNGNGNSGNRGAASASGAGRGGYHDALMAGFGQAAIDVENGARSDGFDHPEGFDASNAAGDSNQNNSDIG